MSRDGERSMSSDSMRCWIHSRTLRSAMCMYSKPMWPRVRAIQAIDQIAEPHRARVAAAEGGHDFAVEVVDGQAVVAWVERQRIARCEAERIELGGEVAVDAVADDELIDAMLEQLRGLRRFAAAAVRGRPD